MTIAGHLGLIACFGMSAASSCAAMPPGPVICYGGRDVPKKAPEQQGGCHAVMGCAAHRRTGTSN